MTDELRMDAYYYGFAKTGSQAVDKVLSAVACAGKAFHHTSEWNDDATRPGHTGDTPVDWIQNAADEAADEIERLRRIIDTVHPQMQARIDKLEAELAEAIERGNDWCDQARKARTALRDLLEVEGWAQDHPRYVMARAALGEGRHD